MQVVSQVGILVSKKIQQWQTVLMVISVLFFAFAYFMKLLGTDFILYLFLSIESIFLIFIGGIVLMEQQATLIKKEYSPHWFYQFFMYFNGVILLAILTGHVVQQKAIDPNSAQTMLANMLLCIGCYCASFKRTWLNEEGILVDLVLYPWQEIRGCDWDDYEGKLNIHTAFQIKPIQIELSKKQADTVMVGIRQRVD